MKRLLPPAAAAAFLLACDGPRPEAPPSPPPAPVTAVAPMPSFAQLERGAKVFQQHCAQCHGPEAQGHPDWQTPGVIAAPPLDGSGTAWKRSHAQLAHVILSGAERDGVPAMPAWKGRLSEADVDAVIVWFQALWPPEVYAQWQQADAAAGEKTR